MACLEWDQLHVRIGQSRLGDGAFIPGFKVSSQFYADWTRTDGMDTSNIELGGLELDWICVMKHVKL